MLFNILCGVTVASSRSMPARANSAFGSVFGFYHNITNCRVTCDDVQRLDVSRVSAISIVPKKKGRATRLSEQHESTLVMF